MIIVTATSYTAPLINHIQNLQAEIKRLEADLKQHKDLLRNDYMKDVNKIVTPEGIVMAQIVSQTRESFQAIEFKRDDIDTYNKYVKTLEITYLKVS